VKLQGWRAEIWCWQGVM